MNILVTLNGGYVLPLCTMLKSIAYSDTQSKIDLYIIHSSLTLKDFQKINAVTINTDITLHPIKVDDTLFDGAPTCKRISKETYYRIFASELLPKNLDRILYIDPDTVILNSLDDFYETDFDGNVIIGAKHFEGVMDIWNRKRLFMKKSERYINAGIMLFNLKLMRKIFSKEKVFEIINKKKHILFLADQDVINIMYDGLIGLFDENVINLDERCFARLADKMSFEKAIKYVEKNTVIIHYNGKYKPWKIGYKGELDGFWHHFDRMPSYRARRYFSETA
ncbi:MAG: glycosyltransferase family 8 protein [Eubacteriales bacterium]|nr:glycosyltransferase family 8 protein [Eubacteriales bacterium]MDD6659818.1 glycosyltransferase family 8 protein [Eubacteriales bacterium]